MVLISGFGSAFSFYPAHAINKSNWTSRRHATIISILQSPFQLSPMLLSIIYNTAYDNKHTNDEGKVNLSGFLLFVWMFLTSCGIFCIIFTKEDPLVDEDTQLELLLLDEKPEDKIERISKGLTDVDTLLLMLAMMFTVPPGLAILNSITSMLQSFRHVELSFTYTVLPPLFALFVKNVVVLISDHHKMYISRIQLSLLCAIPALILALISIFAGDNMIVFTLMSFSLIACAETMFCLVPLTISDRFLDTSFLAVFGIAILLPHIVLIILQFIIGYIYDVNIDQNNICYGMKCFRCTFIILSCFLAVGIACHVIYCIRQKRKQPSQSLKK